MAHHDKVCVVGYHHDSVLESLSLGLAACTGIAETDYTSAQAVYSRLEAESGTSGWLKK